MNAAIDKPLAPKAEGSLLVLLTLAIGFVMAMIDVTAVNVALPDISRNLSVPLIGLVWVIDGYTLTFAALLLAGGALADRFGPKVVYQAGLTFFFDKFSFMRNRAEWPCSYQRTLATGCWCGDVHAELAQLTHPYV